MSAKKSSTSRGGRPRKYPAPDDYDAVSEENDVVARQADVHQSIIAVENGEQLDIITNPHHDPTLQDGTDHVMRDSVPNFMPRKYLEIRAVEYPVPSLEPQGPGDLWKCTFEGCRKRIHGASADHGSKLVRAHLEEHIGDTGVDGTNAREKIDFVLDESRPYLPVR